MEDKLWGSYLVRIGEHNQKVQLVLLNISTGEILKLDSTQELCDFFERFDSVTYFANAPPEDN